jgi:AraC family transcriptional regulator
MGSPRFNTVEVGAFRVTEAFFPPEIELPRHVHERAILGIMLEGGFDDIFPSHTYRCDAGKIFTEPAGDRHANRIFRTGAEVLVIQPDPERMDEVGPAAGLFERIHHFPHGRIVEAARALRRELSSTDDAAFLARQALIYEMIATSARAGGNGGAAKGAPAWLETVREVIHDRFHDTLRIADVAAEVELHPAHVARVFREHHRMTIAEYVRMLRLDWAATQVSKSEEPLSAIALRAGYADQSHFTRAFKLRTGLTPAQYRRLHSA